MPYKSFASFTPRGLRRLLGKNNPSAPGKTMIGFLVVSFIVLATTSGWNFWQSYHRQVLEVEQDVINLSVILSRQAEDTFVPIELAIIDTMREIHGDINSLSAEKITAVLESHRVLLPQIIGLYLFDDKGNLIASTGQGSRYVYNASKRSYFIWNKNNTSEDLFIGQPRISVISGKSVIPVSKRINGKNNEFKGIFLASVDPNYFGRFYSYFSLNYDSILSLLNVDGSPLYVYPNEQKTLIEKYSTGALADKALKSSSVGVGSWHTPFDGQTRVVGYVKLKRYPLIAAASVNKNELQLRWMADNIAAMAVNFLVLISLVFLGTFVLKQIRITVRNEEMLSMMHREVEDQNQVLQELALIDPLTQLANRRRFDLYLEQCLTTAGVEGGDVALAMIDVDFFKRYNDTYGHIEGDRCLAEIGLILRSLPLPTGAQPARYGGEEFSIILPGLSGRQAELMGNEMVEAMRTRAIKHLGSQLPQKIVTVSVGVYSYTSKHPCDAQRLKEGADQALYLAKKKGRNQCIRL